MKPARLAIGLAGAAAVLLIGANPASAAEETVGSCIVEIVERPGVEEALVAGHAEGASEAEKEAFTELEEEMEDCVEAPNLILPETNEIIWGGLAFFILLGAMIRWGFPAVRNVMDERAAKIRADLDAAELARTEAEQLKQQHAAELAETKANANKIMDQARQEAAEARAELAARAETDIAAMRRQADADVAAARQRALGDLQTEVNEIVVGAAERVVEQNLDRNAQRELIDNYISSIGSQ